MSNASRTPSRIGTITFFDKDDAVLPVRLSLTRLVQRSRCLPLDDQIPDLVHPHGVNPGWTTVVESNSSTTAGPANVAPAGSA